MFVYAQRNVKRPDRRKTRRISRYRLHCTRNILSEHKIVAQNKNTIASLGPIRLLDYQVPRKETEHRIAETDIPGRRISTTQSDHKIIWANKIARTKQIIWTNQINRTTRSFGPIRSIRLTKSLGPLYNSYILRSHLQDRTVI